MASGKMKQPVLSFFPKASIDVIDLSKSSSSEDSEYRKKIHSSKRQSPRIYYENGTNLMNGTDFTRNSNGEGSSKRNSPRKDVSTTQSETKLSNKKKEGIVLCHHHKALCRDNLLQCTVLKANGDRCPIQYCQRSLEKYYGQEFGHIITRGKEDKYKAGFQHALKEEYIFVCPSCYGTCKCYMCKMKENGQRRDPLGKHAREIDRQDSLPANKKSIKSKDERKKAFKNVMQPTILNGFARTVQSDGSVAYKHEPSSSTMNNCNGAEAQTPPIKKRKILPPLVEPRKAEKARLERIQTNLPLPNVMERIWIYESLVRFDAIEMPKKAVLQKLDRFNDWSEPQVHTMLVRLSCYLAEIKTLKQNPQPSHMKSRPLIKALQEADKDLTRGEAWQKAKEMLEFKEINIPELEDVELRPDQMASTADVSFTSEVDKSSANTESLLNSRATRSRRAANTAARERVKYFTTNDLQSDSEDESDDEKEDDSMDYAGALSDENDDKPVLRKSQRSARTLEQKQEDDQSRSEIRKALGLRDRSKRDSNASEKVEETKSNADVSDDDDDVVLVEPEESLREKILLPPFEQRIAILSGLIELVLQRAEIRQEVEEGARLVREKAKEARDQEKELLKEQEEEVKALRKTQMDMHRTGRTQEWKESMDKLLRDHLIALMDIRVDLHVFFDANKPRSGPLGRDTDGNVYWHLSEFSEHLPADTTGHWAWSLLVMGERSRIPSVQLQDEVSETEINDRIEGEREESIAPSDRKEKVVIYGTNYADEIGKLINFICHRCELLCYNEDKQLRQKEDEAHQIVDEYEQKRLVKACSRERRALMASHEVRRTEIRQLYERLTSIKEYYQWHRWE